MEAFLWKFQYVEGHLLLERGLISFQNEKIEEPSKLNVDISKSSNFSLVVSKSNNSVGYESFYTPGLFGTTTVDDQIQKV